MSRPKYFAMSQFSAEIPVVLIVEDNPGDARLLRELLLDDDCGLSDIARGDISRGDISRGDKVNEAPRFHFEHALRLSEAIEILHRCEAGGNPISVVLLDLSLPDAHGLESFNLLHHEAPHIPIVVMTGLDDDETAMGAVSAGAQDYLVKGQVTTPLLVRSLRYAMQRQRMRDELQKLSTIDELTGLFNRRGFLMMAEQQLKTAKRGSYNHDAESPLVMFFADLDGMKQINDTFGHAEGDWALIKTAEALRRTFRETDVLARLGGDEFTVLAILNDEPDVLLERLQLNVQAINEASDRPFKLRLSVGTSRFDPREVNSIEELLSEADKVLYEQKRNRPRSNLLL